MKFRTQMAIVAALLLSGIVALAQTPFVPNDPFYNPGTSEGAAAGYYGQWHLNNQMPIGPLNAGLDAGLVGAWNRGLTGEGVTIAIIDDGTQGTHPDLTAKYQNALSWDFSKTIAANVADVGNTRGAPVNQPDNHGTSVAGVAAATGGNGLGMTGSAPLADVAGMRFLTGSWIGGNGQAISESQAEAAAIGFQGQTDGSGNPNPFVSFTGQTAPIRVMNHSYGPNSAYGSDSDSALVATALAESAAKKVIHVFSAGNQRGEWPTQDTNQIAVSNNPNVLVVAALGSNGVFADYSSYGSAVIVTAPSSSRVPQGLFRIPTLDRTSNLGYNDLGDGPEPADPDPYFGTSATATNRLDYNSTFGGTSSAAPLVSGIMALGIQANPDMDVRMAKHLLARTSTKVDPNNTSWTTNAAGFDFSEDYGFGMINADAFTAEAVNVTDLSDLAVFDGIAQTVGQSFGSGQLTLTQNYNASFADPLPLEYVEIKLALTGFQDNLTDYNNGVGALLGDLSGTIQSPSGTVSQFLFSDRNLIDDFPQRRTLGDDLTWTYLSNAFWGESLNGNWTISLTNGSTNLNFANFGTWASVELDAGMGTITIVPEPGSILLFGLGIALIFYLRLRRQQARA